MSHFWMGIPHQNALPPHPRRRCCIMRQPLAACATVATAPRRNRMKIKLHHLNLCSKDVAGMEAFYRSVLDLEPEPSLNSARDTTQGYAAPVAFVTDGQTQVHLA